MPTAAQTFAALRRLTPSAAVKYLSRRGQITPTYSWQDLWHEEHAQQFTVSRLARADLLAALQEQITRSVNGDMSRRDFARDAKALLKQAGWWGDKEVQDPQTGKTLTTRFDAPRLKLIFDTNTRMAYAAGQWQRIEAARATHPYVRYVTMHDDRVRPAHRAWDGVTLPVEHEFWRTHMPPNGWRCRCRVVAVSRRDYERGLLPGGMAMKKDAPPVMLREWVNKRTGVVEYVPQGIDPGFDYNPGQARQKAFDDMVADKLAALPSPIAAAAKAAGMKLIEGLLRGKNPDGGEPAE